MSIIDLRKKIVKGVFEHKTDPEKIIEKCENDIEFFFNMFLWICEPRTMEVFPFELWPHETRLLNELELSLKNKKDLLIEKSRDMGATWTALGWILYHWRFNTGFLAHLGSRVRDCVDLKGDLNTLFERMRFMLRRLPWWLYPKDFVWNNDSSFMKLSNPYNTSLITGESANENFGRAARATVVLLDEFAFWPYDAASWRAVGPVSPVKIVLSTVQGEFNKFSDLRWKSKIKVFILDWREHPEKTQEWYDNLKKEGIMTLEDIASEVDRNYQASSGRPFYREFNKTMIIDSYKTTDAIISRGWDFSYHHPACSFWQQDTGEKAYKFYELLGYDLDLRDFMLVVKYVSGEKLDDEIGSEKIKRIKWLCENHKIENVLKISDLQRFRKGDYDDYCDSAGKQESDKSNMTSIGILQSGEINPQYRSARIDEGASAWRKLMLKGMFKVSKACPITIKALQGGYHFSKNKPNEADKDNFYDHLMDCDRYYIQSKYDYLIDRKDEIKEDQYNKMVEAGVPQPFVNALQQERQRVDINNNEQLLQKSNGTGYL